MPDRSPSPAPIDAPRLQPVRNFVDTFVRVQPDQNAGRAKAQIAQALGRIEPAVTRHLDARMEVHITDEEAAGAEARFKSSQKNWKEAVRAGTVPAGASPHFRRGWKTAEIRNLAHTVDGMIRQEYAQSPLRNSDSPAEVADFYRNRASALLDELGSEYDASLIKNHYLPAVERGGASLASIHTNTRIKAIEAAAMQELDLAVNNTLASAASNGAIDSAQGRAGVAAELGTIADELLAGGADVSQVNKTIGAAIIAAAEAAEDETFFAVAESVKTGTGTLAGTTDFRKAREAAEDRIEAKRQSNARFYHWQREVHRQETTRALYRSALTRITEAQQEGGLSALATVPLDDIVADMIAVDPSSALSVESLRDGLISTATRTVEDPETISSLYWLAANEPDAAEAQVHGLVRNGQIKSSTAQDMLRTIDRTRQDGGVMSDFTVNREYRRLESTLEDVAGKDAFGGLMDGSKAPVIADAMREFEEEVAAAWAAVGPDGVPVNTRGDMKRVSREIYDRIEQRYIKRLQSTQTTPSGANPFDAIDP